MKAYPGKAKKLYPEDVCPNIIFSQSQPYSRWTHYTLPLPHPDHQGKRGHYTEDNLYNLRQSPAQLLGDETSSLFKEAFFSSSPRKKSKLSERLVEKLSKLAHAQIGSECPPTPQSRSFSVDSKSLAVLSRRQILASLEEEKSSLRSSLSSGSLEEPVFSRACLLQSISQEEEWDGSNERLTASGGRPCDSGGETLDSDEEEEDTVDQYVEDELGWEEEDGLNLSLKSLKWIATLGVGGFGRVELVTAGPSHDVAFALKKMKKNEIQDSKQQQHILNEKKIMQSCDSEFIVKLYRTYHDSKYLYMLMEPCLGGELWTLLRRSKRFSDSSAAFYVACVILAFDYLHAKGVIYRDLKPENLLLDSSGYVKLTDFGFSRQLEEGEAAWTFCGTPEYVAPEIITNKSHDLRADIWSLGILVFELLTGAPPFTQRNSSGQVYPEILKGMRSVHFPGCISSSAAEIIRQCCRLSPGQRPSLSHLKHFMWFSELDWVRLADRSLAPPNVPTIADSADYSNFDTYELDCEVPADDYSDWSKDF